MNSSWQDVHARRPGPVAIVERATPRERDADGREILGADHVQRSRGTLRHRQRRFAGNREGAVVDEKARPRIERQAERQSGSARPTDPASPSSVPIALG
jgi:hypothetical protein